MGLYIGVVVAAFLALSCSSSSSKTPTATATATVAATSVPATVKVGDSSLGKVLTDSKGITLYTTSRDVAGSGKSAVSGRLLESWPPFVLTSGSPVKPEGLAGDLGVITRDDGAKQVTYKGLPLYLWPDDKAAGDVKGQGVAGFVVANP